MASRVAAVQVEPPRPSRTYANSTAARPPQRRAAGVPYRVERVRDAAGFEREILTLEDTPEPAAASTSRGAAAAAAAQPPPPVAGPSYSNGNAHASTSSARHDPYSGYEPAPKKRKSDVGASHHGYAPAAGASNGYPQPGSYAPTASTSGTKRKHDDYARESRGVRRDPSSLLLTCGELTLGQINARRRSARGSTRSRLNPNSPIAMQTAISSCASTASCTTRRHPIHVSTPQLALYPSRMVTDRAQSSQILSRSNSGRARSERSSRPRVSGTGDSTRSKSCEHPALISKSLSTLCTVR